MDAFPWCIHPSPALSNFKIPFMNYVWENNLVLSDHTCFFFALKRSLTLIVPSTWSPLRVSFGLALTGFAMISRWLLYVESAPAAWMHFFGCGIVGMVTAYIFILSTQVHVARVRRVSDCCCSTVLSP